MKSRTQEGFATFGPLYFKAGLVEVANRALRAVWYQKWFVHRRLRPEEYGGLVHGNLVLKRHYPICSIVTDSDAVGITRATFGTALLPQAFPEGSPIHPSYGAGHATVAGACATFLKAVFNENASIGTAVVPNADGDVLTPLPGLNLTIGGELNKLASNEATGRNIAGVHWRSDAAESLRLGEEIAISVLRDQRLVFAEEFGGFSFTRFDGNRVTIAR